jgi:hypothetical protein
VPLANARVKVDALAALKNTLVREQRVVPRTPVIGEVGLIARATIAIPIIITPVIVVVVRLDKQIEKQVVDVNHNAW